MPVNSKTVASQPQQTPAEFSFWSTNTNHLRESERRFVLRPEEIGLLSPNTRTCPVFRLKRDAELTKAIYRRVPVLHNEGLPEANSWAISIRRVFDMNKREVLALCTNEQPGTLAEEWLPMVEAKLMHQFDHRFASYVGSEAQETTVQQKVNEQASLCSHDTGFVQVSFTTLRLSDGITPGC